MVIDGKRFKINAEGLYTGDRHIDGCSRFAFLIEDPAVRLDISKDEQDNVIVVKVHCEYKYELNIGYIMEHRYDENNKRTSDHWYQIKSIDGKLEMFEYNRQIGFGEVIMMDQRIINNGTFYRLCEFNKYL